jgi:GTP-binding protein Era
VISDADVIVFLVEANYWTHEDEDVIQKLQATKSPIILVINKIDSIKEKAQLLPFIDKLQTKLDFADVLMISAKTADNVETLESKLIAFLPEGPHLFPDDKTTDKSIRFQIAELIREKLIQATEQEVPYASTVEIENYEQKDKIMDISAIIWVERDGQKPIVIGKNGERLKKIGTAARRDIEKLINQRVFLRLWVKVKDDWTNSERALRSLGYE